jgi:dihydrofolate reductase
MNSIEKLVCSRTIETTGWSNPRVLAGDIGQSIGRLRRQPGKDFMIIGSGSIVRRFAEHKLIDEFRCLVFPATRWPRGCRRPKRTVHVWT